MTIEIRERPIIFSAPMVRAILAGTKTQTRRVVNGGVFQICSHCGEPYSVCDRGNPIAKSNKPCPYGVPGDRLWVRERHSILDARPELLESATSFEPSGDWTAIVSYEVEHGPLNRSVIAPQQDWRRRFDHDNHPLFPPRWMFRWASRITLEVTDVRVQRVQDAHRDDIVAEGFDEKSWAASAFADTWDKLNAKRGYAYASNPWVWAITFKRTMPA